MNGEQMCREMKDCPCNEGKEDRRTLCHRDKLISTALLRPLHVLFYDLSLAEVLRMGKLVMKFSRVSPRASRAQGGRDGAVLPHKELLQPHKNLKDPGTAVTQRSPREPGAHPRDGVGWDEASRLLREGGEEELKPFFPAPCPPARCQGLCPLPGSQCHKAAAPIPNTSLQSLPLVIP